MIWFYAIGNCISWNIIHYLNEIALCNQNYDERESSLEIWINFMYTKFYSETKVERTKNFVIKQKFFKMKQN